MTYVPCSKRTFKLQLANPFVKNYKAYVYLLKFLLQRLGSNATIPLWQNTFTDYDDEFLQEILSTGWSKTADIKLKNVAKDIDLSLEEHFRSPVEGVSADQARQLIEKTPPIPQIRAQLGMFNVERVTTAYEAAHIAFDSLAMLVESLLQEHGKEGELIAYTFLCENRSSIATGKPLSFKQFVEAGTAYMKSPEPNMHSAGLDVEIVKMSDTELILHVKDCEWARYFHEHHPHVGYLIACSTDEAYARACNDRIRMQRTSTIMEGGKLCDFRYYLVE